MSLICPTINITSDDPHGYRTQIERIAPFAKHIHIDLMDGDFAKPKSINPVQVWWPETVLRVDIHLMFRRPIDHIETLVSMQPSLVIIPTEAEGDLVGMIRHLQQLNIKAGVALLQETSVQSASELVKVADHILLFSGVLGRFGGVADLKLLSKVSDIKMINSSIEIGWDGGANIDNIQTFVKAGIDVINVGSAIQQADNPEQAYATLVDKL